MQADHFEYKSQIPCSSQELFAWHESPGAFERLTPYWEPVQVDYYDEGVQNGCEVKLKVHAGPLPIPWHLVHKDYQAGYKFSDEQVTGPFAYWKHDHVINSAGSNEALLEDKIQYRLPLGVIGRFFGANFVESKLTRLFRFRHKVTINDIANQGFNKEKKQMKILISGSSGLVGTELISFLQHQGHEITKLVRSEKNLDKNIFWDPETGVLDPNQLEGFDAIIHLAGESIANKRWSEKQKQKIKDSRINSTKLLASSLAKLKNKPQVFISASAIGYYGDRPLEILNEDSMPVKNDFLSETCVEWEQACNQARQAGIKVANARFGIILSPKGGALNKLLLPFQLGLGGELGNGEQIMSWIALDDVVYALHYLLNDETIQGPVNFTAPNPVSNKEFTKILGKVLSRPTMFPVPSFAVKLGFGEMGDALLLSSQKVKPVKLEQSDFKFSYGELEPALSHLLGKK